MKKFNFMIVVILIWLKCFVSTSAAETDNPPMVSAGYDHTVAVTATGDLYAWGFNQYGQIGDGTTTSRYTPVKIMSDVRTAVAGNSYTLAIKKDGTLWAWGINAWGNFGNGTKSQINKTPIKITDNVVKVCVGDGTTFVIKTDKTLWGCGRNDDFKLGSGYGMFDEYEPSFKKILDNVSDVFIPEDLAAGFALRTDGSLYAWGADHILESIDPPSEVPDERQWIDYSEWYPIRVDTNIAECEFVGDVLYCLKNNGTYTYYAKETFNHWTFYVNQSRYESKNSKKLVYPTESISISNGNYTLYTKNGTTNLYGDGFLYISAIDDEFVSQNSNELLFDNYYYAEFSRDPDVQSVFVITTDGNLWAWGGNSYGNIGAGTDYSYDKPTKIMNLGEERKTYEKYFADNIDGYINQITGLKLPYAYLAKEAEKRGLVSWDLFLENFYGDKLKKDPSTYYKTVLLSLLTKEFSSDSYNDSLINQAGALAFDTASMILGDVVDADKAAVENANGIFDKLEKEIALADSESAKYIADLVAKAKTVGKSATDVIDEYSKYRVTKNTSYGVYSGLCMMKDCSNNRALNMALSYIASLYSDNEATAFGKAYTSEVLPNILQGVWKDAVADDAVLQNIMTKFEIVGGQLEKAYDIATFSIDLAQFGSDVIYPVTSMSESMMKLQSVCVIESYAKQALIKANEQYKVNPTKENALTVVGLYDFLMTIYDYGMNEAKVYAEYYYNHGMLNAIVDIFSNNNQREYNDAISWINSYNGALSDVKWYRTKTEIEYGIETNTLVPVIINTYYAGKVVNSVGDIIRNGNTYNPPAGDTITLPTFFNDITLSVTVSDFYYDSAFTKPYVATKLTTPVTLYRQVTIQRCPRIVVNGQDVTFPDQRPVIENGRTLVPARGVFEALGAKVSWNGNTSTAKIQTNRKDITITIGQRYIVVNAKRMPIDVPAKIINGRTMIPLRAVAEALECEVGWDGATYTATINSK